ncbi:hypothetical protein [Haloprofundus salilacus]|uniref:hypothetical protein n=1 Tax=Haloprofundus salilacus TaxID=2876190 RepID=UPI001CC9506A|nr:hypothetical protein [Haloprofundus salilacus]
MPSFGSQTRRIATAFLGFLFLLSAVFAPFGTIAWTYEYNVDQVNPDDPQLAGMLGWAEGTSSCYYESDECELAYVVKDDSPRIVSDTTYRAARGFGPENRLIIFSDSNTAFYQPNITHYENDTTRVSLRQVSNATALELVSTPFRNSPRGVRRVVEKGTVRTNRPLTGFAYWDETKAIIAHDGAYYRQGGVKYRGTQKGVAEFFRLVALVVGAVLCFHTGRME